MAGKFTALACGERPPDRKSSCGQGRFYFAGQAVKMPLLAEILFSRMVLLYKLNFNYTANDLKQFNQLATKDDIRDSEERLAKKLIRCLLRLM